MVDTPNSVVPTSNPSTDVTLHTEELPAGAHWVTVNGKHILILPHAQHGEGAETPPMVGGMPAPQPTGPQPTGTQVAVIPKEPVVTQTHLGYAIGWPAVNKVINASVHLKGTEVKFIENLINNRYWAFVNKSDKIWEDGVWYRRYNEEDAENELIMTKAKRVNIGDTEEEENILHNLDNIMSKTSLGKPVIVYKPLNEALQHKFEDLHIGDSITNPSFTTASIVYSPDSDTMLGIHLPVGSKAILLGGSVVIDRGTTYTISNEEYSGGRRLITVEAKPFSLEDTDKRELNLDWSTSAERQYNFDLKRAGEAILNLGSYEGSIPEELPRTFKPGYITSYREDLDFVSVKPPINEADFKATRLGFDRALNVIDDVSNGLRNPGTELGSKNGEIITNLNDEATNIDQLISLGTVTRDIVSFRGVSSDFAIENFKIGQTVHEPGYTFTTAQIDSAEDYASANNPDDAEGIAAKAHILAIHIPEGSAALPTSQFQLKCGTNNDEAEIVLPRDAEFTITSKLETDRAVYYLTDYKPAVPNTIQATVSEAENAGAEKLDITTYDFNTLIDPHKFMDQMTVIVKTSILPVQANTEEHKCRYDLAVNYIKNADNLDAVLKTSISTSKWEDYVTLSNLDQMFEKLPYFEAFDQPVKLFKVMTMNDLPSEAFFEGNTFSFGSYLATNTLVDSAFDNEAITDKLVEAQVKKVYLLDIVGSGYCPKMLSVTDYSTGLTHTIIDTHAEYKVLSIEDTKYQPYVPEGEADSPKMTVIHLEVLKSLHIGPTIEYIPQRVSVGKNNSYYEKLGIPTGSNVTPNMPGVWINNFEIINAVASGVSNAPHSVLPQVLDGIEKNAEKDVFTGLKDIGAYKCINKSNTGLLQITDPTTKVNLKSIMVNVVLPAVDTAKETGQCFITDNGEVIDQYIMKYVDLLPNDVIVFMPVTPQMLKGVTTFKPSEYPIGSIYFKDPKFTSYVAVTIPKGTEVLDLDPFDPADYLGSVLVASSGMLAVSKKKKFVIKDPKTGNNITIYGGSYIYNSKLEAVPVSLSDKYTLLKAPYPGEHYAMPELDSGATFNAPDIDDLSFGDNEDEYDKYESTGVPNLDTSNEEYLKILKRRDTYNIGQFLDLDDPKWDNYLTLTDLAKSVEFPEDDGYTDYRSIAEYYIADSHPVNNALMDAFSNGGQTKDHDSFNLIRDFDNLMAAAVELPAPARVFRGASHRYCKGLTVGQCLPLINFTSVTRDYTTAVNFGSCLLDITLPAGTPVINLAQINPSEQELLLDRRGSFKITKVVETNKYLNDETKDPKSRVKIFTAEYVDNRDAEPISFNINRPEIKPSKIYAKYVKDKSIYGVTTDSIIPLPNQWLSMWERKLSYNVFDLTRETVTITLPSSVANGREIIPLTTLEPNFVTDIKDRVAIKQATGIIMGLFENTKNNYLFSKGPVFLDANLFTLSSDVDHNTEEQVLSGLNKAFEFLQPLERDIVVYAKWSNRASLAITDPLLVKTYYSPDYNTQVVIPKGTKILSLEAMDPFQGTTKASDLLVLKAGGSIVSNGKMIIDPDTGHSGYKAKYVNLYSG